MAIDFETANSFRGSPCQVGLTRVLDGVVETSIETFLRPPPGHDYFNAFNTMLHGIGPAQVKNAPGLDEYLPELLSFADGLPFVAHNAAFDMGVLRDALDEYGIRYPDLNYFCTLVLSRRQLNLISYSLPFVAEELDVEIRDHHAAGDDSRVSGEIALRLIARNNSDNIETLAEELRVEPGRMNSDSWSGCHSKYVPGSKRFSDERLAEIMAAIGEGELDPNSPIAGQHVVFTGTLGSMPRAEAHARVMKVGGFPENSVTRATNILVFGVQDPTHLRPGASNSSKFLKAVDMRSKGYEIEVMDEVTFLRMLSGD